MNVEIIYNGKFEIHADGILGDYTLCGHDQDGDDTGTESWSRGIKTNKPINCKKLHTDNKLYKK